MTTSFTFSDKREPSSGGLQPKTSPDWHAGESETSKMLIARPDTVHMDRAATESGADQHRQNLPEDVYTGIWWYARFPRTLFRRRLGSYVRTRQIPDGLVDRHRRKSHPLRQS